MLKIRNSQNLKRSIAVWGDKLALGLEALSLRAGTHRKLESVIAEIAKKHGRSRRHVFQAMSLAKHLEKGMMQNSDSTKSSPASRARYFLIGELKDGPRDRGQMIKRALRAGIATRTLERAYKEIGAISPSTRLRHWELSAKTEKYFRFSRQNQSPRNRPTQKTRYFKG